MFVKELIKRLKEFDPDESIRFYFLKNFDLKGCELESIISADDQIEITIQDELELVEEK